MQYKHPACDCVVCIDRAGSLGPAAGSSVTVDTDGNQPALLEVSLRTSLSLYCSVKAIHFVRGTSLANFTVKHSI